MEKVIHDNKKFEGVDYTGKSLNNREFNECTFVRCNFNSVDLSGNQFMDCTFIDCDLSMAKTEQTGLKLCVFKNSKLLGVDFSKCSTFLFAVKFDNCLLDYAVFYKMKIKKTLFDHCSLKEANFAECDLSASRFTECNLEKTVFENTNLTEVDFRTAQNYQIHPELNRIKKAKFSYPGVLGLLMGYGIVIE